MTGETHFMVGAAAALLIAQPKDMKGILLSIGVGAIGGLVSDIDLKTSKGGREFRKICFYLTLISLFLGYLFYRYQKNYFEVILSLTGIKLASIMGAMLCIMWFGSRTAHRSFTHSIEFTALLSMLIWFLNPSAAISFASGCLSHIVIDAWNKKPVRISVILKWNVSLGLTRTNGFINTVLLIASGAAILLYMGRAAGLFLFQF